MHDPPRTPFHPAPHRPPLPQENEVKTEYRVWNPFRSKLAAAVLGGVDNIWIAPGSKVLYLGAASGTSVSHVADVVGDEGVVYAVEFSHRPGRDLINMAKKRTNVIPIIEDARHPLKYRMLVGMVDVVFADVAQPDQARIVALNAHQFLKNGGHSVISIKANCIDSTATPEAVFAKEVKKLQEENFKPLEQITLECARARTRACGVVVGGRRPRARARAPTARREPTLGRPPRVAPLASRAGRMNATTRWSSACTARQRRSEAVEASLSISAPSLGVAAAPGRAPWESTGLQRGLTGPGRAPSASGARTELARTEPARGPPGNVQRLCTCLDAS